MHIKQVVISGFRSFRAQSEIEPFSPRHNVIVGRNGSGKSNFFDAIQFVLLNQRFSSLRQEERQVLLHEGAGDHVNYAYVELIFDNTDGRLAQDGDEVKLRRHIGLKKDEFFLNGKRVTKQEVSSLLESAGFSKSNPYYIVQQGKVSTLTLMKDAERLNLLKEVAGTKVYEERRQESLQIMDGLKNKCEKIQSVITGMEERLAELEEEKEELGAYQKYDKQRRALEYTLYEKELTKAQESRKDKAAAMRENEDRMMTVQAELEEAKENTETKEKKLTDGKTQLAKLEEKRAAKDAERLELLGVRGKLELAVKDLSERVSLDEDEQKNLAEELKSLERKIEEREAELEREAGPEFEKARASLNETQGQLTAAQTKRDDLYAKQSRGSKYNTAEERDAALRPQVMGIRASAKNKQDTAARLAVQVEELEQQVTRQKERASAIEEQLKVRGAQSQDISAALMQKTAARNDLAEQRKEKWRVLEELQDKINEQKNAHDTSKRDLRYAMPRNITSGLEAVRRLAKELHLEDGVYGPVYDNFVLKAEAFATAVEVAGGNSIFNVIVDTDDTAARLMTLLERRKLGRVTFMPLNKLKRPKKPRREVPPHVCYLIEEAIKFRPEVEAAMEQIFGKKILAQNLEEGSRYSETQQAGDMDVVTMAGDEFNRRGGISGGYHDLRTSRLLTLERIRRLEADLKDLFKGQKDEQMKAKEFDQAVANIMGEIQKLEVRRVDCRNVMAQLHKEVGHVKRVTLSTVEQLQQKGELLDQVRREAEHEAGKADVLEAEIGTPLMTTLTDADQRTLRELNKSTISTLNSRLKAAYDALEVAADRRTKLLSILNESLKRRREEVREKLDLDKGGIGGSARSGEAEERMETLAQRQEELTKVEKSLEVLRTTGERLDAQALKLRKEVDGLNKTVHVLKESESGLREQLAELTKVIEKLQQKHALCVQQAEQNQQKKQDLGTLPSDQHEQYKRMDTKKLMKKLNEANENLKRFSHVNKKALDQYVSFSEQREALLQRKEETDKGEAAIKELIESLDMQKDEAILRTFRGVSRNFSAVFQELVPSGSGRMIMKTSADLANHQDDEDEDEDDEGQPGSNKKGKGKGKGKAKAKGVSSGGGTAGTGKQKLDGAGEGEDAENGLLASTRVSDFVGVQIKVSFVAAGETFLMSQLSGGQKAVVALALIFAIQRCDPAPFYLFDEIDQALDSSYRAAVASLIQRQAHSSENPTQFITTTFRPEMVAVASQCYGISHQNKVSNIHVLPREEALGFVANIMNEEEAVGVELQQPATSQRSQQEQQRGHRRKGARLGGRVGNGISKKAMTDEEDNEEEEEDVESMDDDDGDEEAEEARPSMSGGKKRRVGGAGQR